MHATHPAASVACPPTFPRFPIGHPLQLVRDGEPFTSDHVPRGQFPQSSKTVAPNATKYLPAGQSLQPSALLPYLQEEGGWRNREGGGKGRIARGHKGIRLKCGRPCPRYQLNHHSTPQYSSAYFDSLSLGARLHTRARVGDARGLESIRTCVTARLASLALVL